MPPPFIIYQNTMKTKIPLSLLSILLLAPLIASSGVIYQPMETEYQSTLDEYGEDWSLAMENADRNMINHLSCPNHNPNGIWV